jgi:hypothetical protein
MTGGSVVGGSVVDGGGAVVVVVVGAVGELAIAQAGWISAHPP